MKNISGERKLHAQSSRGCRVGTEVYPHCSWKGEGRRLAVGGGGPRRSRIAERQKPSTPTAAFSWLWQAWLWEPSFLPAFLPASVLSPEASSVCSSQSFSSERLFGYLSFVESRMAASDVGFNDRGDQCMDLRGIHFCCQVFVKNLSCVGHYMKS